MAELAIDDQQAHIEELIGGALQPYQKCGLCHA